MIAADPQLEMNPYPAYGDGPDSYTDEAGNEYEYDAFLRKWARKIKKKRAQKPRVIDRRLRRDNRRLKKGKKPKHPELQPPAEKEPVAKEKARSSPAPPPGGEAKKPVIQPLSKQEAQAHKNVNKALQEEFKTKQEELKTLGIEKKVAQEDVKTEKDRQQAKLIATGRGVLLAVCLAGGLWFLYKTFRAELPAPAGKAKQQV